MSDRCSLVLKQLTDHGRRQTGTWLMMAESTEHQEGAGGATTGHCYCWRGVRRMHSSAWATCCANTLMSQWLSTTQVCFACTLMQLRDSALLH